MDRAPVGDRFECRMDNESKQRAQWLAKQRGSTMSAVVRESVNRLYALERTQLLASSFPVLPHELSKTK